MTSQRYHDNRRRNRSSAKRSPKRAAQGYPQSLVPDPAGAGHHHGGGDWPLFIMAVYSVLAKGDYGG
jgi:hypothetical protein